MRNGRNKSGQFTKGNTAGGRTKGSINKEKKKLREMLTLLVENNYDKFVEELNKLDSREFVDRFISLLEYSTPKLNRTDISNDDGSINIHLTPLAFFKTDEENKDK